MSYKKLRVYCLSLEVVLEIHQISLSLPQFEMYETGSQIRRSSKSTKSNIVEGYGRKRYINEYIRFLIYAQASNDETLDHLETLFLTGSFDNKEKYTDIRGKILLLGKSINQFIKVLEGSRAN